MTSWWTGLKGAWRDGMRLLRQMLERAPGERPVPDAPPVLALAAG